MMRLFDSISLDLSRCARVLLRVHTVAGLLACSSAQAFLVGSTPSQGAPGGTSELVFMAWDNNTPNAPKVAFIKDLGVTMDAFFISAQQDAGTQSFWYLGGTGTGIEGDATWAQFLSTEISPGVTVDLSKVQWAVFAYDGDENSPEYVNDDKKLFTTLKQATSGDPATITGLTGLASDIVFDRVTTSMISFVGGVNAQPGHMGAANENGSAIILQTTPLAFQFPFNNDVGNATIGNTGQLNYFSAIGASAGNLIGESSWFYKVSRTEDQFDQSLPVVIDEFDNLGSDGYWGFAAASDPARAGQYFLSYTIAAFESPAERAAGLLAGNNFARLAGVLSLASPVGKSATVLDLATNFLRGVAQGRAQAAAVGDARAFIVTSGLDGDTAFAEALTSAVPEPQTWLLWGAGLGFLARRSRRRMAA